MKTVVTFNDYRIEFDGSRNWTVTKRVPALQRKNTKNEESEKLIGYYGTLQASLRAVWHDSLTDIGEIEGLQRLQEAVDAAHDTIRTGIRKLAIAGVPDGRVRE